MNQHLHRLVFSRRLGATVAVAETARAAGKAASGARRSAAAPRIVGAVAALASAAAMAQTRPPVVFASRLPAPAAALPAPYGSTRLPGGALANPVARAFAYDPSKGAASADLSASGRVGWSVSGHTGTFDQGTVERVVVNWDSFDIGAGYKVHFKQDKDPAKYVSALNRIWSADPTQIFGMLSADREVVLLNANGVYFGRGARVDTGKFVATTLSIADSVFDKGLRNVVDGSAVFSTGGTDYLPTRLDSGISVEAGAELRSAAGGDVLLIAPRVVNQGRIVTPAGQTVLAAGDKVYLMSSSDPKQRGLIVAVDPVKLADTGTNDTELGVVENTASGSYKTLQDATVSDTTPDATAGLVKRLNEIRADSGTVNLVGLTVRQKGNINATTAVKGANGAIYLQAMASTAALPGGTTSSAAGRRGLLIESGSIARVGADLGTVEIGPGSVTAVRPDAGAATQLDAETFHPSRIRVEGAAISVAGGARIEAPAGTVELLAAQSSTPASAVFDQQATSLQASGDNSRIVIAPDASISVAGLRDVEVDGARNQGAQRLFRIELADAPVQRDGPLYRQQVFFDVRDAVAGKIAAADVRGAATAIARTANERATVGGTLRVESEGTVVIGAGAKLDVSGGSVHYSEAVIENSLVRQDGRVVQFRSASVGSTIGELLGATQSSKTPAYTEGQNGGTLSISGRTAAVAAGTLRGEVTVGERQRAGTSTPASGASLAVGRQVGNDFYLGAIRLHAEDPPAIASALFSDTLGAPLDSLPLGADLALPGVQAAGFGTLTLRATDIRQQNGGALDLGVLGRLDVRGDRVALDGRYTAPGGTITVATVRADASGAADGTGDIRLSGTSVLDVAGLWTNDSAGAAGDHGRIQVGGGTVSLNAARSALLEPGAVVDVSAGARLGATGSVTRGTAGSITITTGRSDAFRSTLQVQGTTLKGFDFGAGGRLTLGAPELTVSQGTATGFTLVPEFFSSGGFGTVTVDAFGDVLLAGGTQLAPKLQNLQFGPGYRSTASGPMSSQVASPALIDGSLAERSPVNLSFTASRTLGATADLPGGSITIERGATIDLEPGAKLLLSATRNLEVGARGPLGQASVLRAPGGQIDLRVTGVRGVLGSSGFEGDPVGYLADQAIWLGSGAQLWVSGTARLRPDGSPPVFLFSARPGATATANPMTGTVWGGGSITLEAQRGYVVAEQGSRMALDGFKADVHLPGLPASVQVAKSAGTLKVTTPEGYALEGSVSAHAPLDAGGRPLADGGRLDLAIGAGGVATGTIGNAYPDAAGHPRQLVVGGGADAPRVGAAQPGADLGAVLGNGIGWTNTGLLSTAGFDSLRLASGDQIRFDQDLQVAMGRQLVLDAPATTARPGSQVALSAAHIVVGDNRLPTSRPSTADTVATRDESARMDTSLRLDAPLIELVGHSTFKGFSLVTLDTVAHGPGEVRLLGPGLGSSVFGTESTVGSLNFAGKLALAADVVYAVSGTEFTIAGLPARDANDAGSLFEVRGPDVAHGRAAPLSAFGALSVTATDIDQGGVLHQPFGAITLSAERTLRLAPDSLTAVTGSGAAALYGQTDNLSRWLLPTGSFSTSLPRSASVKLSAATIDTAPTAKVDGQGGGDVKAWEFFPGVGGSTDYFNTPGLYAVLPDYGDTRALALGDNLPAAEQGRQIVITMPGSGLAPGRYNLLPARFALLADSLPKGAFLVRRASDQGKTVLQSALPLDDGGVVVTAHLSEAGSFGTGSVGERFVVEPGATALARSEIRLTSISKLLAAGSTGASTRALPRDGAQIQVSVSGTARSLWSADLALGANGGAAGTLDFSANTLALVDDLAKTPAGALGVGTQGIGQSGAGSVLLGGLRSAATTPNGSAPLWNIDGSLASAVTVDIGNLPLAVEELVLAARNSVSIADGTRLSASRAPTLGPRTLAASGDGAFAIVSANDVALQRTNASLATGNLTLGSGAVLTGQRLALDATGLLTVDPSASLNADALALGARHIVVGAGAPPHPQATVLDGALLSAVRAAPALQLRSYSSIDFVGTQNWSERPAATAEQPDPAPTLVAHSLVLDAPVLRGLNGQSGPAQVDIAAESVVVRNTTGQAADPARTGQGTLVLQALPPLRHGETGGMVLGPGTVTLGFDTSGLRSSGDIVLQGTGATRAQGDINLRAARLTAGNAADQALQANAGVLTIAQESTARTLGERVGQGAHVALLARSVQQLGTVDLPGGSLAITASGTGIGQDAAIRFGAVSNSSVAGFALPGPEGFDAYGPAGSISATASTGRVEVLGTLDVSATQRADGTRGVGNAGSISLSATGSGGTVTLSDGPDGTTHLLGKAGRGATDLGGGLAVDVRALASADALAAAAVAGGLDAEFGLRVRTGNLALGSDIRARQIAISADAENLALTGLHLDATAPSGGRVQLAAGKDLTLAGDTRIDARSLRTGANGGDVLLASSAGRITLSPGASIDTRGDDDQDGRIVLRAQRGTNNSSVKVDPLGASHLLAGEVDIEAVRSYRTVTVGSVTRDITSIATGNSAIAGSGSSSTGTLGQASVRTDNNTFMNSKASVLAGLGVAGQPDKVHLVAGVEVLASGNLAIASDWQLTGDRPGGEAGFLTLRAAGNLNLNGSLSDGFSTATSAGVLNDNTRSWSYRLAAGADLNAANPLATQDLSAGSGGAGTLTIGSGRMVRTGAGSIDMAAGRDISFAAGAGTTPQGMAYVAGRKASDQASVLETLFAAQSTKPILTDHGGRLTLRAARDIVSPQATQLINNWFWRSGLPSGNDGEEGLYSPTSQLAWWSEFSRFRQTLGSFGGGDLWVSAGRDIVNLQAMAPSTGWADSRVMASAALQVRNGGDVTVRAGRDVLGGQFFAGAGDGRISAGGSVGDAVANTGIQEPVLALMNSAWRVTASGNLTVTGGFNPTAMSVPNSSANGLRQGTSGYFYTWGEQAGLDLAAASGDLSIVGVTNSRVSGYGLVGDTVDYARVFPASLNATAAGGNIDLFGQSSVTSALLFPSTDGQLRLWAGGHITLGGTLAQADSSVALWPSAAKPVSFRSSDLGALNGGGGLIASTLADALPRVGLHAGDLEPVQLHAEGSIRTIRGAFILAKESHLSAGADVLDLQLAGQNLAPGDRTTVTAGRDIVQTSTVGKIEIGGPGTLEVSAGRDLDLGASLGVLTIGNQANSALPAGGASIRLTASASPTLDLAAFSATLLDPAAAGVSARWQAHRDLLTLLVREDLKQPALSYEQAWDQFRNFPPEAQRVMGQKLLAAEFGAVYLGASAPGAAQMTATLQTSFEQRKAQLLQAGAAALAAGQGLTLPGREVLRGGALAAYLDELRGLTFASLDLDSTVSARVANLSRLQQGWRDVVATSLGGTVAGFDALAAQNPQSPALAAYQAALGEFSGPRFESYRDQVLRSEIASTGASASLFGRKSLPMRLALFDQGFQAAELTGAGSFAAQPVWPGASPAFDHAGSMKMTQSSVITERGGDISLVNAGGPIEVGLKESASGTRAGKGVITLGGGDVFGYSQADFQVNNQRVFVVGQGNMDIWASAGDIDSGRGANTAVAAPPLAARRSVDGVVFELPATTTGSGLGILEDAAGRRAGTIGLYPAFGEILALDAFIRAPSVVLGATIRGADNLQAAKVGGAAAPVQAPVVAVAPPSNSNVNSEARQSEVADANRNSGEARPRNSLLTVDLMGLGPAPEDEDCNRAGVEKSCPKPSN